MRSLFAIALVGCSSFATDPSSSPTVAPSVATIPVQQVSAFQSRTITQDREPVAAWTLTASDGSGLKLVSVDAKAVIEGPLAFTELHLRFSNPENRVREGTFAITLPMRAAVSRFAMEENGALKEAEVVAKALARRAYDDFLHRGIDPALLEKAAGNAFTARVFPIPARAEKHIVISYSQEIANDGYVLPLRGLPKTDTVTVQLDAVRPDGTWERQRIVEKAWTPDRDFVANVVTAPAIADGQLVAAGFEIAPTFTEASLGLQTLMADPPTALTLFVDTSASRAAGFKRYVEKVHALVVELARRYDGLAIEVIAFDQDTFSIFKGAAKDFGAKQVAAIVERGAGGASDLSLATAKGRVVIVTDAVDTADLVESKLKADRVDVLFAGGIRDELVAQKLVKSGTRIGDIFDLDRESIEPIAVGLGAGVRTDVPVEVADATWVYPKTVSSLRSGTQITIYAKLRKPAKTLEVTIGGSRKIANVTKATPALLGRAAARAEIEEMEARLVATPDDAKLEQQIEQRSVASRVISSQTTMLVLDTEQDYARYGIDRKSLADILVVGPNGLEQTRRKTFVAAKQPIAKDEIALNDPAAGTRTMSAVDVPPEEGHMRLNEGAAGSPQLTREQAIAEARSAGMLGSTSSSTSGHASLTGTGNISSGFDDSNIYGGLVGSEAGESPGGYGYGRTGTATGRYGTIGSTGRSQDVTTTGAGAARVRSRVAKIPTVTISQPVSMGSIDKPVIKRYIKRQINQISYCYERELLGKPTLEGVVQTQFMIGKNGKVTSATAIGVDENVAKCVADVIKQIEFPTVQDGNVIVNYPFTFRISGSTAPLPEAPPAIPLPQPLPNNDPEPAPSPAPEEGVRYDGPSPSDQVGVLDGKLADVMRMLKARKTNDALAAARTWQRSTPGDVLAWIALGEAQEALGDKASAARSYGSIIDLFGSRADYRRFAGERLERTGDAGRKLAIDTYRRAVADRPDQLTGHRLLAYSLVRAGDQVGALDAIFKGIEEAKTAQRYLGAQDLFTRDAGMIAAAAIAAGHPGIAKRLAEKKLPIITKPTTRFLLYWETDANDVDLHVSDRNNYHAWFQHPKLPSGGELYADVTTGYGPECFEIVGPAKGGPYDLSVHYYAQGPMGYGMGLLQIVRFNGKQFTFEDRPYIIMKDQARVSLGRAL